MLQARTNNYMLVTGDIQETTSMLGSYYEPGFNVMSPVEMEYPRCDRLSIRLKKRDDDTGTSFGAISSSTMNITVKDPTNGMNVPYSIADDGTTHVVLTITNSLTLNNPTVRVRVMDVYVRDATDDDFINLRVLVADQDKTFHYIPVSVKTISDRSPVTAQGRDVTVSINASSDHYILFSPYASLTETTGESDFSYPLNTIYYKRQETYNNEDYFFSISAYSHLFMQDVVSVMNVPSYQKAGVLLVDNKMYKDIVETGENSYVEITAIGELSGISDVFKINFTT